MTRPDALAPDTLAGGRSRRSVVMALGLSLVAFVILLGLGTWQVQRLHWKEGILHTIDERMHAPAVPLSQAEERFASTGDVDYMPVTVRGTFVHEGERHFFSTWEGASGFDVYTPLRLADGRFVLVNRGFVPYDRKDPATRPAGLPSGPVTVTGLARDPLAAKPSWFVPDNDIAKNVFYWKDRDAMAASAGLPAGATVLPFFVDADNTPNPGILPIGGVTIIDFPNNHLQYAITWYGLALALLGVVGTWLWRYRKGT